MKGGIYTRENCPLCGQRMVDNHRDGCSCPAHKNQRARKLIVKFPSGSAKYPPIFINFQAKQYDDAVECLMSMRLKRKENAFDPRDYLAKSPLAFTAISERWLDHKRRRVKTGRVGPG